MDRDLFLAILSMDSYNRGYDQGIKPAKINGSQIGNAIISQTSAVLGQEGGERRDVNAGFFGIAYSWGDETVISYRGSDKIAGFADNILQFLGVLPAGDNDVINGYGVAAGYPNGPQAKLAIEFYRQVANGDVNPATRATNISVTGHSLGAGLSGLVAGLYHLDGTHFDPMPFGAALETADFWGFLPPTAEAAEFVGLAFGGETPWLSQVTSESQAYAIASNGIRNHNQLDWARNQFGLNTGIDVDYLSLPPDVPFSITDRNGVGQAHANNLIVMAMFGNRLGLGNLNWKDVAKYFIPALFDEQIGFAAGGGDIDNTPIVSGDPDKHDYSGAMRDAIAYSALDEGALLFGNVGIRALFNDANELGEVLAGTHSSTISASAESIARVFAQFAGRMAIAKVTDDSEALEGVVSIGADTIAIDLSLPLWQKGEGVLPFEGEIVGRQELVARALSQLQTTYVYVPSTVEGNPTMVPVPAYSSDLLTGLRTIYGDHALFDSTDPTRVIDRVVFQRTDSDFAGTLLPRLTQAPDSGVTLFAMGGGNDQVDGSSDSELIYGGDGFDIIRGGDGDDLIAGGAGNDVLSGGAGRDFLAGGAGEDRIDLELDPESAVGVGVGLTAVDPPREGEQSYFAFSVGGAQADYANGIEKMWLSSKDDTVIVTSLGDPTARSALADLKVDFKASGTPALYQDTIDLSDVAIDNYDPYGSFSVEADLGVYVDLSYSANQEVRYLYDYVEGNNPWIVDWLNFYQLGTVVGNDVKLKLANANTAIGTENDDYLIGNGGKKADGEGYSTLIGGGGNDLLKGAGWETHIWGGDGADIVSVGIGGVTVFEDADTNDRTRFGFVPLFGGVQAWWNETGTATWAPMSSLMAAFPFVGAQALFSVAAMAIDAVTMKFAKYRHDAETGDLIVDLGWGLGGSLIIKDYDVDLNTGRGDAGITVFRQGSVREGVNSAIKASNGIEQYVNLALYAGFGLGLSGFDPLVLDLDDNGYDLISREYSQVYFEFDSDGFAENAGWIGGNDAFLVRDLNSNGSIDSITEMFGNRMTSGFTALAALDSNSDGVFNSADADFATVMLWKDKNSDGVTDAGELISLAEAGVASISLTATTLPDTDVRGNVIVREGSFTRTDGTTGNVGDVALDVSDTDTRWTGSQTPSQAAADLPQIAGIGELVNLRLAMTSDATLLSMVNSFAGNSSASVSALRDEVEDILYRWAGVDGVTASAIGSNGFDARKLAFLEKYVGIQLMPRDSGGAILATNLAEVEALWNHEFNQMAFKLIAQGPLAAEFSGLTYYESHDMLRAGDADTVSTILAGFLDDMPPSTAAAEDYWADWGPLLGSFAGAVMRTSGIDVGRDYFFGELVKAVDSRALPLDIETLAAGLAIDGLKIGGVSALTRTVNDDGTLVYYSESGSQHFVGGAGQDAYVFGRTIGNAVINDEEAREGGDRIRFAFLTPDDVTMVRDGNDLLITVTGTGETIRVLGQFAPVIPQGVDLLISSNKGVEDIQFSDGTIYETSDIAIAVGKGTSGNDQLSGTMHSDVLQGLAGDDILMGGDDADIYVVNGQEGHDTIREVQTTVLLRSADVLILGENIAPDEIEFVREGEGFDDLRITLGTGGSVLIEDQFDYTSLGYNNSLAPNSRIEVISFRHYAQSWSNKDIENLLIQRSTTAGDDITRGFGNNDYFLTSAGNDVLIGMDGGDIYEFELGSGDDIIDEQSRYIDVTVGLGGLATSVENDVVRFKGLTLSDVSFKRLTAAPDLTITILATGETLTVKNQFDGFQTGFFAAQWLDRIERFEFADGGVLNWQEVAALTTTGTDGDDQLWGDLYADRMVGGLGNDTLSGGGKADEYVFNLGDGADIFHDDNWFILGDGILTVDDSPDYVTLGAGITPEMVSLSRNGNDLTLHFGSGGDSVTLKDQNDMVNTGIFGVWAPSRIEEIRFASGTVWTWQGLNARWISDNTTSGNDVTSGFALEDVFEASAGNDILAGGDSGDIYRFGLGSGQDIIRESVGNVLYGDEDSVEFAAGLAPEDIQLTRDGSDLIVSLSDGSSLTIEGQFAFDAWYTWQDIELFKFSNGVNWTAADIRTRFLTATSGNDTIIGFDNDDVIDGGAGDDILRGGNGSDTYHFGIGSGHDVIEEDRTNTNLAEADRVIFGPGLLPEDLAVARDGDDLILTIVSTGETLTIKDQFAYSEWFAWWDVERFEFANGTVWTDQDIAVRLTGGTSGDDTINGTFRSDTLDGGAGNDILIGGDGADTYIFGLGYGQDEIRESRTTANLSEDDQLRFGPGITESDLTFVRDGDDLVISINGTTDSVRLTDQWLVENVYAWNDVERFTFDDGSFLTNADIQAKVLAGTSGDDHLYAFVTADRLDGGAGNDILEGLDGSDTYVFGIGYGHDEIVETVSNVNFPDNDSIEFGAGISWEDLTFSRNGDDLTIYLPGGQDSLFIAGQLGTGGDMTGYTWQDVESLKFQDGTVKTKQDIFEALLAASSTAGNDIIEGFYINDVITGGLGNDVMSGGRGADTYVHNIGDGHDTVSDYVDYWGSTGDRILLGAGITIDDVTVSASSSNANDLVLSIFGGQSSVTLKNQISGGREWEVDAVEFADGTIWTKEYLAARFISQQATSGDDEIFGTSAADEIAGGAGNDILHGRVGNDTLIGGAGNDVLHGEQGQDIFVYSLGDGDDIVDDDQDANILQFGAGIAPTDLYFSTSATNVNDVVVRFIGNAGSITLKNQISAGSWTGIQSVRFADGTNWNRATLLAHYLAGQGTAGDDYIGGDSQANNLSGGDGNDNIRSLDGNDQLSGGAGNDQLEGGNGEDVLIGGSGNDILIGGSGNDSYQYVLGDGVDVIADGASDSGDKLVLGAGIAAGDIFLDPDPANSANMIIRFAGSGETITVQQQWSGNLGLERIEFADGSYWDAAAIATQYALGTVRSGNDTIAGTSGADTLAGGAGNDTMYGRQGNDVLIGGTGNDILSGEGNNDIYRFALGDGQDIIRDFRDNNGGWGGNDALEFASSITPGDVTVTQGNNGADLLLSIVGGDSVLLQYSMTSSDYRIEQVRFADGTVWSHSDMVTMSVSANSGNDVFYGSYDTETLASGAGNDTIYGRQGNDVLIGGTGNDLLTGDGGNDTYRFALGDGNDTVADFHNNNDGYGGADVIEFAAGIVPGDITVTQANSGNDLLLSIAGGDSVLVKNTTTSADYRIEQVRFADGTIWSHADLVSKSMLANSGNDVFYGSYDSETLSGDTGNDTLYGRKGNDILIGGAGNDLLTGDGGNDTYRFALGDGNDTVADFHHNNDGYGGTDVIEFAAGIAPGDITVTQANNGNDLLLSIVGGDSILVKNTTTNADYRIEQVRFDDGTIWSHADLVTKSMLANSGNDVFYGSYDTETLTGGAGNDTMYARHGNDVLIGGTGNDTLSGDGGNDIYRFALGNGNDTVADYHSAYDGYGGNDTVEFAAGIAPGDITVTQANNGNDLLLSIAGGDSVLLRNTMNYVDYRIEQVRFDDGTVWSHADLVTRSASGTSGNDIYYGTYDADTLSGAAGNDTLDGRNGNDILSGGDGNDVLNGGSGTDTVDYSYATANLTVSLAITTAQTVAAGDVDTITNVENLTGGSGNDALTGNTAANVIRGGLGDDVITAGAGNDVIDGGSGDDQAVFAGVSTTYSIVTSGGNVSIADTATSTDGNDGTDTLIGIEQLLFKNGVTVNISSPIILDLDGDGVTTVSASSSNARYDMDGDGLRDDTSWMGTGEGLLFLDRDGDGKLSNAGEFGFVSDVEGAASDLVGLRAFDSNGDGILSSADVRFADFRIWQDRDGDGVTDGGEIMSLAAAGVQSLNLAGTAVEGVTALGDVAVVNKGSYTRTDGTTMAFIDAALTYFSAASALPTAGLGRDWFSGRMSLRDILGARLGSQSGSGWNKYPPLRPQLFASEMLYGGSGAAGAESVASIDRKLAAIIQDMASFGAPSASEISGWSRANTPITEFFA